MSIRNAVLLLGVCLGPVLSGQPIRPEFAWWENPVANGLNLTEAQQKQVQTVVREFRNRLVDLNATVQKAEGDLGDIFDAVPVDNRRANDAIDKVASARAELTKAISQMSLRLRAVLTPEQWQELRRRGGPGGRGRVFPGIAGERRGGDRGPGGPRRGPNGPPPPNAPQPPNGTAPGQPQPPPPPQGRE